MIEPSKEKIAEIDRLLKSDIAIRQIEQRRCYLYSQFTTPFIIVTTDSGIVSGVEAPDFRWANESSEREFNHLGDLLDQRRREIMGEYSKYFKHND